MISDIRKADNRDEGILVAEILKNVSKEEVLRKIADVYDENSSPEELKTTFRNKDSIAEFVVDNSRIIGYVRNKGRIKKVNYSHSLGVHKFEEIPSADVFKEKENLKLLKVDLIEDYDDRDYVSSLVKIVEEKFD